MRKSAMRCRLTPLIRESGFGWAMFPPLLAIALLNFRPRKRLGWRTPYEVFFDQVLQLT